MIALDVIKRSYGNSRGGCTKGKGPRMPCVNVYREDLKIHAARMKADRERTRDLMGRHRATSEGLVNVLMNHQGVRHACRKGLALARLQVGPAIILGNTLKWHKIQQGRLAAGPLGRRPAAGRGPRQRPGAALFAAGRLIGPETRPVSKRDP